MAPRLAGKTAVITGAARGIGAAIAARFAAEGCSLVVADIDEPTLAGTAARLSAGGARVVGVRADVTDRADVEALFSAAESQFGAVDVVVNNAGIFGNVRFEEMTDDQWDAMLRVNAGGVFAVSQTAIRRWLAHGRPGVLVNMASVSARVAFTDSAHYSASKAAVAALTRCLAAEFGPAGIRANAIAPGIIETEMTADGLTDEELSAAWTLRIPSRRFGTVEDVAQLAVFLASPESSYINGEVITLDGGASPNWPKPSDQTRTPRP